MSIASVLNLVRPNVAALTPYSSARDEFTSDAKIFLDANENPYNWAFNRYPDPYQKKLKEAISEWRGINTQHIFIGNGSDEIIDLDVLKKWSGWENAKFLLDNDKLISERVVEKMSKSKYNVVTPDDICNEYGAAAKGDRSWLCQCDFN